MPRTGAGVGRLLLGCAEAAPLHPAPHRHSRGEGERSPQPARGWVADRQRPRPFLRHACSAEQAAAPLRGEARQGRRPSRAPGYCSAPQPLEAGFTLILAFIPVPQAPQRPHQSPAAPRVFRARLLPASLQPLKAMPCASLPDLPSGRALTPRPKAQPACGSKRQRAEHQMEKHPGRCPPQPNGRRFPPEPGLLTVAQYQLPQSSWGTGMRPWQHWRRKKWGRNAGRGGHSMHSTDWRRPEHPEEEEMLGACCGGRNLPKVTPS
ncbi:uncharacterized protein LOC112548565 isoform X2 [Alligator sinensis]|uniref:Uncharacterized protein LOC112548565 isoform X2 n=1 Tax=Alligator sinensis TaxID=38654 RepID=A0A3Q0FWF6_ALLSI|nr:uncharacterized protein LOC112548565 isoform X2 [Alligator sinensis]